MVCFPPWTGQSGAGCYGDDPLPPWEVVTGAARGAQATLGTPTLRDGSVVLDTVMACAGGCVGGPELLEFCTPFHPGLWFLLQSLVKMGEPSYALGGWSRASCIGTS